MDDLTFERLIDWAEGRLDPADAMLVRQAVDSVRAAADAGSSDPKVERIRAEIDWIESFQRQRRAVTFPDLPAGLSGRLDALFSGRRRHEADHFLAELVRDSHAGTEPGAVRGVSTCEQQQLVYLVGDVDLVLDVTYDGSMTCAIHGQVFVAGGSVEGLEVGASAEGFVRTDRTGSFRLPGVAVSATSISVRGEGGCGRVDIDVPIDLTESA